MKKLLIFILVSAGLVVVLFLLKNWIIKTVLTSGIKRLTGFDTQIQTLRLDLENGATLRVEGLTILNPYQFDERIFTDIPELYIRLDLFTLLKKKQMHLHELRLSIRELNIEKDAQGTSNVSLLSSVAEQKEASKPSSATTVGLPFYLDRFELTLRKVSYRDRSSLVSQRLSVDLRMEKEVFEGITDPSSIVNLILMKIVTRTPFGNLNLDPRQLEMELKETVNKTFRLGDVIFSDAPNAVTQQLENTVGQVEDVTKEKVASLLGKVKSVFQSSE